MCVCVWRGLFATRVHFYFYRRRRREGSTGVVLGKNGAWRFAMQGCGLWELRLYPGCLSAACSQAWRSRARLAMSDHYPGCSKTPSHEKSKWSVFVFLFLIASSCSHGSPKGECVDLGRRHAPVSPPVLVIHMQPFGEGGLLHISLTACFILWARWQYSVVFLVWKVVLIQSIK